MEIYYYVHEYTESIEFPEVFLFASRKAALDAMLEDAFGIVQRENAKYPCYVTMEMDGDPVQKSDVPDDCDRLNVQWSDGLADCFLLGSQQLC